MGPLCSCAAEAKELPRPTLPGHPEAQPPRAGTLGSPHVLLPSEKELPSTSAPLIHPPTQPLLCLAAAVRVWISELIFG